MAKISFQSDSQRARFTALIAEYSYRLRVAHEVAKRIIEERDQAHKNLLAALHEVGVPESAEAFLVKDDGIHYQADGEVLDSETNTFGPAEKPQPSRSRRRSR